MRNPIQHFAGILLLCLATTAVAQEEAPPEKVYQIDVIVFRNLSAESTSSETWPGDPEEEFTFDDFSFSTMDDELIIEEPVAADTLATESEESTVEEALQDTSVGLIESGNDPQQWFRVLEAADRGLQNEYSRVDGSGALQPLLYTSWQQPVQSKSAAESFEVIYARRLNNLVDGELSGNLRLYKERYLHLELNLSIPTERRGFMSAGAPVYKLSESRRIKRVDKLHYFDHPKFSAIAQITLVEVPEED